jgi:lipopolysaccharide export system ATP-binding protein
MPLLEVRGLVKFYGRRKVVDGVDFDVDAGEVVGLLGPNGAGKTTSFRMTTGQITPKAGHVHFNGQEVTHLPMYRRARLGMGYLSQETSVFRRLTVEQNIVAILEAIPTCRSLGRRLNRKERWERTDAILDQFGLNKVRKNKAARLSGGEKRRLEIARCLVCEPLLILLDEPFTGIDPKTIADIQNIVRELRNQGIGILLTDHNVREALKITDRSYLIKDGKVRTRGTPQEIIHDRIAIEEYLGEGFNDDTFRRPHSASAVAESEEPAAADVVPPVPFMAAPAAVARSPERATSPELAVHRVLEQERIRGLIELLRTEDHEAAAAELLQRGSEAIPSLIEALGRKDVELRRLVCQVLQDLLQGPIRFDPYAPEALRRQQISELRHQVERRAG